MNEIKKIFIIDDEKDTVLPLISILEDKSYRVDYEDSGIKGIEKAISIKPDIIILDVILPDLNGYQICRKLKTNEATKDIPILMLTAKESDDFWGLESGADVYINKPYDPMKVVEQIEDLILEKYTSDTENNVSF